MAEPQTTSLPSWRPSSSTDGYFPPNKRQRLSPNPSPISPNNTNFPIFHMLSQGRSSSSFNTPQPVNGIHEAQSRQNSGAMGPPSRPPEKEDGKATDIKSLFDMATGIGIDEKEEESYLLSSYRHTGDSSFVSQSSQPASTHNSFDLLNQSRSAGTGTLPSASQLSQASHVISPEDEIYEAHKSAARAFNKGQQYHLDDPFLWGQSVRGKVQRIATEIGIKIPVEGLFDKIPDKPTSIQGTATKGPSGAILELKAPSILTRGAPLEAIIALISLAANERIRGLVEDSFGLARSRRSGSDGVVPPTWYDLVPEFNSQIVNHSSITMSNSTDPQTPTHSTVSAQGLNPLGRALQALSKSDRLAEEAREKKRKQRLARKAAQSAAGTPGIEGSSTDLASPSAVAGTLANGLSAAVEVKMTKKERDRLAKADQTDEVLRRNANQTAIGQLGGGKKYSWLQGGGRGAGGTNTPLRRSGAFASGSSTIAGAAASGAGTSKQKGFSGPKDRMFGDWREGGEDGRGIQLKDWVAALEADGRDKRTLAYALIRLDGEKSAP